jgi:hypothetical protein
VTLRTQSKTIDPPLGTPSRGMIRRHPAVAILAASEAIELVDERRTAV